MIELNRYYHDRGLKKYSGFYLSEHSSEIESSKKVRRAVNLAKPQMTSLAIQQVLNQGILKSSQVSIQIEAVNEEGYYYDDVVGRIVGYDELGIYISNEKVGYDEIRHVKEYQLPKWSDLSKPQ